VAATLAQVRDGLVEVLTDALPGVNIYRLPAESVTPPAVIVAGMTGTPIDTDGGRQVEVDLYAVVNRANADSVDELDAMLDESGADSIPTAINSDLSLGARALSATVVGFGEYREMEVAGTAYYAATATVRVWL
jgi:hypothetical protein